MSYKILHRSEQEIFRLSEVKNFLRISHDYDDMWIMELINSSIEAAENFLRIKLLPTKIQVLKDRLRNSEMTLPLVPVIEIISVSIKTSVEDDRRVEKYSLEGSVLKIHNPPHFEFITVEYVAGYANQNTIPAAIKQGALLHTAEMYDSHGANSAISDEVRKLYQPYKKMLV